MTTCKTPPADKRAFVQKLGRELHARYGTKRFYSIRETRSCMQANGYPIDLYCWGHAIFVHPGDFSHYHESIGERCDQAAMKLEMGGALGDGADASWFGLDLSWLEWPDIDFSGIFDFTP